MGKTKGLYWLPLILVLAASAVLLVLWAFIVPVFESPDEPHHWKYAQYIHSHLALPPYTPDYLEAPQAPLYYLLVSPFASPMAPPPILGHPDNENALGFRFQNMPIVQLDVPCPPHFFANCRGDWRRYWPIRRARLATALFALVAILFTALAAFEVSNSMSLAVIAGTLIGFLPQFDFRGATVNNDPALVCFCAIATYLIVRMVMRGFEVQPAIVGAVAIALAFLSKISAAVLVPVFVICVLFSAADWRTRLRRVALVLAVSGAITLPWFLRNKAIYGDFLAGSKIAQTVPMMVFPRPITDPYFRTAFLQLTSRSFFGFFGWMNVKLPGFIYKGYALLFLIALCGLLWASWRRQKQFQISLILGSIAVLSLAFLVYASLTYPQPQGRLLYPSLSAVMVLAAAGLGALPRLRRYIAIVVALGGLSVNVYALTRVIHRAYWGAIPMQTQLDVQTGEARSVHASPQPLLSGHSYVQSFVSEHDGMFAVEVSVASEGVTRQGSLQLSLSTSEKGPPLASVQIPANAISSAPMYAHLEFPSLADSAGKKYLLTLENRATGPPARIQMMVSKGPQYPQGALFIDGRDIGQDADFRSFYSHPCWSCPPGDDR